MLTLLSTFISFLMGGLPKVLDFFQDRSDKSHELKLAALQTERELQLAAAGYAGQAKVEEIKLDEIKVQSSADTQQALMGAQEAEVQAIYAHDISLNDGTSEWMKNFRASVRPVITFGFFGLLVFVDVGLFSYGWYNNVPFKDLAEMLWNAETQALFAAIIAFHFGGRAFGK